MAMGATWSVTIGTWVDHDADSWLSTHALFGQSLGIDRAPRILGAPLTHCQMYTCFFFFLGGYGSVSISWLESYDIRLTSSQIGTIEDVVLGANALKSGCLSSVAGIKLRRQGEARSTYWSIDFE